MRTGQTRMKARNARNIERQLTVKESAFGKIVANQSAGAKLGKSGNGLRFSRP
jgi:hypothetical protein